MDVTKLCLHKGEEGTGVIKGHFGADYLDLKFEGGGGQKFPKYANVIFVRSLIANDDYSTFMLSPWYFNPLYRTIQAQSVTNWV